VYEIPRLIYVACSGKKQAFFGIRPPAERPLTRLAPARSARVADIREYPRPGRATQDVDIPEYPRLAERPAEHWSPIGPPSLIR
jgi:hypothetical protein